MPAPMPAPMPANATPTPEHLTISPSVLYFGTPVVLVVTRNPDSSPNITPMSSAWALGTTIVLGLSSAGQGALNLQREGRCTLNFPSADLWPRVEKIARATGRAPVPAYKAERGVFHSADKFALGGFTAQEAEPGGPPRILECPLQIEATVLAMHDDAGRDAPDAPSSHWIIQTRAERVHARRDIVLDGTDHIDTARWNPLFYVFRHYFGDAADMGRNFRAES